MQIYSSGNIFFLENGGKVIVSGERNSFQVFEHISNKDLVVLQSRFGGRRYTIHWKALGCSSIAECVDHVSSVIYTLSEESSEESTVISSDSLNGLLLHPSIYKIENRFISPNSNEDIILHGGCFDPRTTVEISSQTVNTVTYINDKTLIVNISSGSEIGTFNVIAKNGTLEGKVLGGIEVGPLALESIEWKLNSDNTVIVDGVLTKTIANGWNAGAISTKAINYSDGYMEITPFYPTVGNFRYMVGLSYLEKSFSHSDIQFAFYFSNKNYYIYENGRNSKSLGPWSEGDKFKVEVIDDEVVYKRNGIFVYRSTVEVEYPLFVDCSIYDAISMVDIKLFGNLIEL
ncbi:MAG: putative histone methyltransferase complex subunit ash2 [uncultured marine phage]|uniref:Putative histone methyltransferase complex subunit ash2 n=1 Tax=uncultured marine phage TaxID=707152 RepID=A0A8D9CD80_9VIRU|nr:MAG: putative histone methyltransferase complex subunit ash2 [uncultured marine phage]